MNASTAGGTVNVIIVEDESLYRDMLRLSLGYHQDIRVVGTYEEPYEVLMGEDVARAHVAILDIELSSDINGFELGLRLRRRYPELGIVLLSNFREEAFLSTLRRQQLVGWAYLLKNSVADVSAISRAIKGAAQGMVVLDPELVGERTPRRKSLLAQLTPRQRDILGLMAQGYSNQAIADRLNVSVKSVENHMGEIIARFQIDSADSHYNPRVSVVLRYLQETQRPATMIRQP